MSTGKATYLAADSAMLGRPHGRQPDDRLQLGEQLLQRRIRLAVQLRQLADPESACHPHGPGGSVASFVEHNLGLGRIPIVQLQMAGYVAADGAGPVTADQIAPSSRWKTVAFAKGSPFTLAPSTTDSVVYMDEEVKLLVKKFGRADQGGVPYYALDNEPALWGGTDVRIRPQPLTFKELLDKSEALAKAVKAVDPSAGKTTGSESFGAMEMWGCYSGTPTTIPAVLTGAPTRPSTTGRSRRF